MAKRNPRTLVIANPNAGGGRVDDAFVDQVEARAGFRVCLTERAGHARELARAAIDEGYGTVVAAGGDGTLNEVVNGLAADFSAARLGLLPLGTGNDFARILDIPADLERALDILELSNSRPYDVGLFEGAQNHHHFINIVAGGASGEVSNRLDSASKKFWGPLAYLRAAIETVPELTPYRLRLRADGGELIELDTLNVIVANARYIASGIPIAPNASARDGWLDIIVFEACSMVELANVTARALAGQHLADDLDRVQLIRARNVEIEAEPALPFSVDGELVEAQTARCTLLPGVLDVAIP